MESEQRVRIEFSGDATFGNADEIRDQLQAALNTGGNIDVDCSAVTETDISFIQLLLAARASARRKGAAITLGQPLAPSVLNALRRGGFIGDTPLPHDAFWTGGE